MDIKYCIYGYKSHRWDTRTLFFLNLHVHDWISRVRAVSNCSFMTECHVCSCTLRDLDHSKSQLVTHISSATQKLTATGKSHFYTSSLLSFGLNTSIFSSSSGGINPSFCNRLRRGITSNWYFTLLYRRDCCNSFSAPNSGKISVSFLFHHMQQDIIIQNRFKNDTAVNKYHQLLESIKIMYNKQSKPISNAINLPIRTVTCGVILATT